MKKRQIRRECTDLIESLNLTVPFSLEALCQQISERRGRQIRMAPLAFPASGPAGLLVSTAATDFVFYEANTTTTHQTHVIVHEFGHLLWGHLSGPGADDPSSALVPDEITPALIQHMLGRTQYGQPEEYAAEYFATQVLRLVSGSEFNAPSVPPDMSDLVKRLERSLHPGAGKRRW
ncbi:hypothetical protein [Streptomyces corynorhini]|uniref:IrrE N-terminal-like domain-containing protein n=1 Tax=Streptomyces corynorhini TaxID=2282652 RepID=A0A370BDF4_9ACTN|nr:hypothetical protein [Streptomyces corynorhini]RDG39798.1 hypothetical protein DVH02_01800 [Streptomyces corynorhini]